MQIFILFIYIQLFLQLLEIQFRQNPPTLWNTTTFFLNRYKHHTISLRLTSIGRYTEKLKGLMRREGIETYRKGGEKLEMKVKESTNNKKKAK